MFAAFDRRGGFLALVGFLVSKVLNQRCCCDLFLRLSCSIILLIYTCCLLDRIGQTLKELDEFGILIDSSLAGVLANLVIRSAAKRGKLDSRRP